MRRLILVGQQLEEVGSMAWSELGLQRACWSVSLDCTKNIDVLQRQPRREGRQQVFGEAEGPFQGWSNAKAESDKRIVESGFQFIAWQRYYIGRTVATRMAELGTLSHVVETILNDVSGHKADVARINHQATYVQEKHIAFNGRANYILRLIGEPDDLDIAESASGDVADA